MLSGDVFAPLDVADGALGIGVNGIKMFDDMLYFVNLDQQILGSVPFDLGTGKPKGDAAIISDSVPTGGDDLLIKRDGKVAWIAINGEFEVFEVNLGSGVGRNISDPLFRSITALAYPRGNGKGGYCGQEKDDLYITGAVGMGNATVGGLLLADASLFA